MHKMSTCRRKNWNIVSSYYKNLSPNNPQKVTNWRAPTPSRTNDIIDQSFPKVLHELCYYDSCYNIVRYMGLQSFIVNTSRWPPKTLQCNLGFLGAFGEGQLSGWFALGNTCVDFSCGNYFHQYSFPFGACFCCSLCPSLLFLWMA
jgi:hypothetical protein